FFCSVLCPLGTTIDLVDRAGFWKSCRGCRGHRPSPRLRRIKYAILAVTLILGILGIQFASLVSPTVIATRLYGVVVYGPATQLFRYGIGAIRQVTHQAGAGVFEYVTLPLRTYDLLWPSLLVCGVTLAGTLATPRFWCRYLCPAGAVFALLSLRPLVLRRTVNASCTSCGACARACPMGAIGSDPMLTEHSECILCGNCASVCPESAVSFTAGPGRTPKAAGATPEGRRAFLAGVLAWSAVLLAGITALKRAMIAGFPERGHDAAPVRPPGSLPEKDFLAACIGCGACMAVCPTNTLQPAGVSSGLEGLFSPVVVPRRGPCDATCTACSTTCPTGAIRRLSPEDKPYAKMGTARIDRETCLAWAKDTACLICDEVCPY
ncbi:MAG TPA: 4Fe-4S binding protein, partial [Deltaproteobacteria bacterium]|nr:4Fe-4S binding protein [Deltaproteobacteria bacterium]